MSAIIKSYKNIELNLSISTFIDYKQNIWFKGRDIAKALGYGNTKQAIIDHVDDKYKSKWENIKGRVSRPFENVPPHTNYQGGPKTRPFENTHPHTIFIKEPGLYALIFSSKMKAAKQFQDWVFSDVLPSIRKYGFYKVFNKPNALTFKIQDEYDHHTKVVSYIRRFYPDALLIAGLSGENQDSSTKRIKLVLYERLYKKTA